MKDIRKLNQDIKCDKDCPNNAVVRIQNPEEGILHLCPKHRREFEEEIREKIKDKFEGLSQEEIAQKIVKDGEGLI